MFAAAAVEPVGDLALPRAVLLDVGVEHQQRHPADLRLPDAGVQLTAAGQREGHPGGCAVLLLQQRQRKFVGVEHRILLLLPAVPGQRLAEVAVPVEQAHTDEGYAQVAGGLEMVAA